MKRIIGLFMAATLAGSLAACSVAAPVASTLLGSTAAASTTVSTAVSSQVAVMDTSVEYDAEDLDVSAESETVSGEAASVITLTGSGISYSGSGATVDGSTITITAAGSYRISGVLNDGQIIVDTQDAEKVVLLLNGVDITSSTSAPIYVANAEKVVITLVEGTENTVTDADNYVYTDAGIDEPDAAIFSHDDLTINGAGSLTVNANYNHGIAGKDDLKITGGDITVNAVNDGIRGRDSLAIKDGVITVNAGGDGLVATNDEETDQGYIVIEGGTVNVNAADDALNAVTSITIDGGDLTLAAGDDGIHAETAITVNGGEVNITESYEGIESNLITINDGQIHVVSSDDGINATSGAAAGFGPGAEAGDSHLYINGGYVVVDAQGDGLDANGSIDMTAGVVLVNGPTMNGNGALDYNGAFNITGGVLVAAGSAGMAQAPSTTSTQYSLAHTFASAQAAGTLVTIATQDGQAVVTFAPTKAYQSIVVSSPELVQGGTYIIYTGGSSTGAATDGLYTGGEYTSGAQAASYTLTSTVTGATGGMGMGGGMRGRRP